MFLGYGTNCMRTISYTLILKNTDRDEGKKDKCYDLKANKSYRCIFKFGKRGEIAYNKRLRFCLNIKLESIDLPGSAEGCITPAGNITRPIDTVSGLYNNADLSDVEIQCGDLMVKAHKNILVAHSETFRTAFNNTNYVEGKTGVYRIAEEHLNPATLQNVLKWMYLIPVKITTEKVVGMLEAAEYFQMGTLKEMCENILISQLNVENCLFSLDLAYKFNIKLLKRQAADLLFHNRWHVMSRAKNLDAVIGNIPQDVRDLLGIEEAEIDSP